VKTSNIKNIAPKKSISTFGKTGAAKFGKSSNANFGSKHHRKT
jgi:hypothetical protein